MMAQASVFTPMHWSMDCSGTVAERRRKDWEHRETIGGLSEFYGAVILGG